MRLSVGPYILEVNTSENKSYYKHAKCVSESCSCDGCLNYELAIKKADYRVKRLFKKIGVDIKKPAEVYATHSENSMLHYGGFYHLCGEIVKSESPRRIETENAQTENASHLDEEPMICIGKFKFGFHNKCVLVNDKFPKPVIQMKIRAQLPWMLKKGNTYI